MFTKRGVLRHVDEAVAAPRRTTFSITLRRHHVMPPLVVPDVLDYEVSAGTR
jgi:hypothetical protein